MRDRKTKYSCTNTYKDKENGKTKYSLTNWVKKNSWQFAVNILWKLILMCLIDFYLKIFPWIKCTTFSTVVYVFNFVSIVLTFTLTICFVWISGNEEGFFATVSNNEKSVIKRCDIRVFLTNFSVGKLFATQALSQTEKKVSELQTGIEPAAFWSPVRLVSIPVWG